MFLESFLDYVEFCRTEINKENQLDMEQKLQRLKTHIFETLPFRWVKVMNSKCVHDYAVMTLGDGYCSVHLSYQIQARWKHFQSTKSLLHFSTLASPVYHFPDRADECLTLLEEECTSNLHYLKYKHESLRRCVLGMIDHLKELKGQNRLTFTSQQHGTWGAPTDSGILFLKDVPFMLFSSEVFKGDLDPSVKPFKKTCGKFLGLLLRASTNYLFRNFSITDLEGQRELYPRSLFHNAGYSFYVRATAHRVCRLLQCKSLLPVADGK